MIMTITDLITKLENIRDTIDVDADPDVFIQVGGHSVVLSDISYHPETPFNYESVVLL